MVPAQATQISAASSRKDANRYSAHPRLYCPQAEQFRHSPGSPNLCSCSLWVHLQRVQSGSPLPLGPCTSQAVLQAIAVIPTRRVSNTAGRIVFKSAGWFGHVVGAKPFWVCQGHA